jgi:hypothetical protein
MTHPRDALKLGAIREMSDMVQYSKDTHIA